MPYRVMASYPSANFYRFDQQEVAAWENLAAELPAYEAWTAAWFIIARKFFLYGAAKEFNINFGEVDRIVDFMITLESTLVPEHDFVGRRLRERGALLLNVGDAEANGIKRLLRDFYEIRSTMVHGSHLSANHRATLARQEEFEVVMRRILVSALRQLPEADDDRTRALKNLFEVPDVARGERVLQLYQEISAADIRAQLLRRMQP
jgi:hypothetical protein